MFAVATVFPFSGVFVSRTKGTTSRKRPQTPTSSTTNHVMARMCSREDSANPMKCWIMGTILRQKMITSGKKVLKIENLQCERNTSSRKDPLQNGFQLYAIFEAHQLDPFFDQDIFSISCVFGIEL